jgi:hypothetical protein
VVFDNMSTLSDELSDSICRLATGACYRNRRLYTDKDEEFFRYRKPALLNGIDELPTRGDLLSRSLLLTTLDISEKYNPDFEEEFEKHRGEFFGAMLDVLAAGLKELPNVKLERPPRMKAFARFGIAIEVALGYTRGSFMEAYGEMLTDISLANFEASPVAIAVHRFLKSKEGKEWKGTALELLEALSEFLDERQDELIQLLKHPKFPKTGPALSAELTRSETALKKLGVSFVRGKTHLGRFIELKLSVLQVVDKDKSKKSASA